MDGNEAKQPFVLIVLAKDADAKVMQHTIDTLSRLQVVTETVRLDDAGLDLLAYIQSGICRGLKVVVFGTHYAYTDEQCPTVTEALVPVIKTITGPPPAANAQIALNVATTGFGVAGAVNAGIEAARILARVDPALATRLRILWPPSQD